MQFNIHFDFGRFKVNRVVRHFVLADLFLFGGWGLISPIFAVFLIERIPGISLVTIGATSAVYWIVKSIVQIPVSLYLDKHEGERDDFYALITSLILAGFTAMAFLLVDSVTWLFIVMFLQGVSFGLYIPSWYSIFSRHLDKDRFAFDWSLDSTSLGIASGITALVGGTIANYIGFSAVYILVSVFSLASALVLMSLPNLIFPKKTTNEPIRVDHLPSNIQK
ncbi:MAG: MFS transporter [Patescibacteria group bacterium]